VSRGLYSAASRANPFTPSGARRRLRRGLHRFIAHSVLHIAPSMVALLGAGILVLISRL
jgi:hypothetical protein